MARRRLRQTERDIVDSVVDAALADSMPHLHEIERVISERLLAAAPAELTEECSREFMNRLGAELDTEIQLILMRRRP